MGNYPKFQNEIGVPVVGIGCREFECIGEKPPQDHPHIYLNMGDATEIVCPFVLRFTASIRAWVQAKLIRQIVHTKKLTENDDQKFGHRSRSRTPSKA